MVLGYVKVVDFDFVDTLLIGARFHLEKLLETCQDEAHVLYVHGRVQETQERFVRKFGFGFGLETGFVEKGSKHIRLTDSKDS